MSYDCLNSLIWVELFIKVGNSFIKVSIQTRHKPDQRFSAASTQTCESSFLVVNPLEAVSRYTAQRIQQMAHAKLIRRPKG